MPFCTNCGAPVEGQFCPQCGTPVSYGSVPPGGTHPPPAPVASSG
ncbi:MAG: hypothetical protein ACPL88_07065, partial [Bryobacteraceae bacterium]